MIRAALASVGSAAWNALADTGALWRLTTRALDASILGPIRGEPVRLRPTIRQIVRAGYSSLPLVSLISLLLGMIVALQSAYQLQKLGALNLVASLVAITVTRELAPLLTAIIVSGRYGSSISAELGTMKVSQEIDALTVMGIDPISFLVVPRTVALLVSVPCLTILSDLVGIAGGMAVSVWGIGLGSGAYLSGTLDALQLRDIVTGLVKAVAFAGIIGLIGCQRGLATVGGAEGVGKATTSSVVRSIVLIIGADLLVTALTYVGGGE